MILIIQLTSALIINSHETQISFFFFFVICFMQRYMLFDIQPSLITLSFYL